MRFISLILIGFLGCDDGASADPPEDGAPTDGARSGDGALRDGAPEDAATRDSTPGDASRDAALTDGPPGDGAFGDAVAGDAEPADRGSPPLPDASSEACQVDVREADGTLVGRCVVPAEAACQALAECLCQFPVEPMGFGDCMTALTMPRALVNLSDMCGVARLTLGEVVRRPEWRDTWDQGRYQLEASPVCDRTAASF